MADRLPELSATDLTSLVDQKNSGITKGTSFITCEGMRGDVFLGGQERKL